MSIATNIIQSTNSSLPKHILKNKLKEADTGDFKAQVEAFRAKYAVEPISL